MKINYIYFFLFIACTVFAACDTEEPIPAFLEISGATINAGSGEGSASHNIRSVWLFVNNQSLGVYELRDSVPTSIPILEEGPTFIGIQAGIAKDGILGNQAPYPFYTIDTLTLNLTPGAASTVSPVFGYKDEAIFVFNTTFEIGDNFENNGGTASMTTTSNGSEVFEGSRSAVVRMTESKPDFNQMTTDIYVLPSGNKARYLEFNYRNDVPFEVQMAGLNSQGNSVVFTLINIASRNFWNKIYIDITDEILQLGADEFDFFTIGFKGELPDTLSQANVYLDNVKMLFHN